MKQIRIIMLVSIVLSVISVLGLRMQLGSKLDAKVQAHASDVKNKLEQAQKAIQDMSKAMQRKEIQYPKVNALYGTISVKRVGFKENLYYGDSDAVLEKGIGQYTGSGIPGEGKPILLAGHNGTRFKELKNIKPGDIVDIKTTYGEYQYRVNNAEIMDANEFDTNRLQEMKEYLIMYTCYPFTTIDTPQRYFSYAEYVLGPKVEGRKSE